MIVFIGGKRNPTFENGKILIGPGKWIFSLNPIPKKMDVFTGNLWERDTLEGDRRNSYGGRRLGKPLKNH